MMINMDNNQQIPTQKIPPTPSDQNVSLQEEAAPSVVHPSVTGHGGKEAEPAYIAPSETLTLHPEVEKAGVEVAPQAPALTPDDQAAGLSLAKESTPVFTQPSGVVQLPDGQMTPQEAALQAKNGNVSESKTWLATLIHKLSLGIIKK